MADEDDLVGLKGDERIVREAKDRFRDCEDWESEPRRYFRDDTKFANGDPRNGWQWPDQLYTDRENESRPCLTINKVRQHNLQIINDARQNKPSIKIRPTGGEASYESAQAMQSVIRRIEYISKATVAYDTATKHQVEGGIGYVRIQTDYVSDNPADPNAINDQDIFIRRVKDPMAIYLDPDIREVDGSDARFGFIFDDMPKEVFDKKYPKFKNEVGATTLGKDVDSWLTKDHVRVAEYYRRNGKRDTLISYINPDSKQRELMRKSEVPKQFKAFLPQILESPDTQTRDIIDHSVEWFLIAGDKIIDRAPWAGKYIPIVRLIGEETIVDGKLDRKGHTRNLIDAQRMFNYNASGEVEFGALQSKSPYTGAAAAFEGQEEWKDSNRKNYAFLQFNHLDVDGKEIPQQALPQRSQPPMTAPVFLQGMQDAQMQMMMASGQYQSQFGEKENATSGKAISERQRQGDNATYHYIDNLGIMVGQVGRILLDLIPKIYDTERVFNIMAEDGTPERIKIDPNAAKAYEAKQKKVMDAAESIFNPNVGEYDVQSEVGPNYATQRQEAWNAFVQIVTQSPDAITKIGDLMFKAADFPMADQIAERFLRDIKQNTPWLLDDDAVGPLIKSLQAQVAQGNQMNGELMQKLAEKQIELKGKDAQKEVNVYKAHSERITAESNAIVDLQGTPLGDALLAAIAQTLSQSQAFNLNDVIEATKPTLDQAEAMGQPQPQLEAPPTEQMPVQ